jgi:hypothetical protein
MNLDDLVTTTLKDAFLTPVVLTGPPAPSVTSVHAATHGHSGPRTSDLAELLERASTGTRKSRLAGERITKLMTELRATLAVELADRAALASREKAREGIRARVAELETELAKAKAQLRGKPKKGKASKGAARSDRLTKGVHPCTTEGCDRTFDTGQGASAHRRRAHEGWSPSTVNVA